MGWIDQDSVTVPYAAQQSLPPGGFLPGTHAAWAAGAAGQHDDATGFVVTVTNRTAVVIPVGAVAVQSLIRGQPYGGAVTISPDAEPGIGPGETSTFADTLSDAGGTVVVSERTYLRSTCTASVPVAGMLG